MELVVKYQHQLPEDEKADFWHRFATDKDVKAKFLTWLKANYLSFYPVTHPQGRAVKAIKT